MFRMRDYADLTETEREDFARLCHLYSQVRANWRWN